MAEPVIATSDAAPCASPGSDLAVVDRLVMGRLLNTFLREVGSDVVHAPGAFDADVERALRQHGLPIRIELPATRTRLWAALVRSSASGHHEYEGGFVLCDAGGHARALTDPLALADALLLEIEAGESDTAFAGRRRRELLDDIATSVSNTRSFARAALRREGHPCAQVATALIRAEQSVVFGHPFHPAPKGSDAARRADLERYRPELSASFQLGYLAIRPELVLQDPAASEGELVAADVVAQAQARLPARARSWPLLPVHPYQDQLLHERPSFVDLVRSGDVIPLGALGEPVFPTSSVRTVYAPRHDRFIKLALDTRITNFVRNNPLEHLERSVSASRLLARVLADRPDPRLQILPELGYRTIRPEAIGREVHDAAASFGVLFRGGFGPDVHTGRAPIVLATLLEPDPENRQTQLAETLWLAAHARGVPLTAALVCEWMTRYCETGIVPLLSLFIDHGISLEAHAQNALVVLSEGWPIRLYVRDLEGTSVSRPRAAEQGWFGGALTTDSSMLVDDAEAVRRLLYYVIVNHAAHLVSSLAACGPAQEWQLWLVVRAVLQDEPALFRGCGAAFMEELLGRPDLPAKANLMSRFKDTSERPLYVAIPNPLSADAVGT